MSAIPLPGTEWIVIRQIKDDQLRISKIQRGYRPPKDNAYTYGGPFKSLKAARKAIEDKDETLRKQLYLEQR